MSPEAPLLFLAAPSVPVMDTERCTVLWDSATLRWSPAKQIPGQTYTLEYCRQYELEGEGLRFVSEECFILTLAFKTKKLLLKTLRVPVCYRSISGVSVCEQRVVLQPNENYLFYIKAVNEAGASEQSEAALISTKGQKRTLMQ